MSDIPNHSAPVVRLTALHALVREVALATAEYVAEDAAGLCDYSARTVQRDRHAIADAVLARCVASASDGDWEIWNALAHTDSPAVEEQSHDG